MKWTYQRKLTELVENEERKMSRIPLNFLARSDGERDWMLENTWCDACGEADLGMDSAQEYKENGRIYVEGNCRGCGGIVQSEVCEKDGGK